MKYFNAILMTVAAGVSVAVAALVDNQLSQAEAINIAIAIFGAGAVYLAPVLPDAQYVKWGMAALVAALSALVTFIGAGGIPAVTISEWLQVAAVALAAIVAGAKSIAAAPTPAALRR